MKTRTIVLSPIALEAQRKMREAAEWANHGEARRFRLRVKAIVASVFFVLVLLGAALAISWR